MLADIEPVEISIINYANTTFSRALQRISTTKPLSREIVNTADFEFTCNLLLNETLYTSVKLSINQGKIALKHQQGSLDRLLKTSMHWLMCIMTVVGRTYTLTYRLFLHETQKKSFNYSMRL